MVAGAGGVGAAGEHRRRPLPGHRAAIDSDGDDRLDQDAMMRSIRRRLAAEEGMTLVELMVAMLILAVVFAGMAQTIITSLSALHAAELRT
ncbi:hypothetical protein BH20ACT8_BH20ACT8_03410 [soil metagenome]